MLGRSHGKRDFIWIGMGENYVFISNRGKCSVYEKNIIVVPEIRKKQNGVLPGKFASCPADLQQICQIWRFCWQIWEFCWPSKHRKVGSAWCEFRPSGRATDETHTTKTETMHGHTSRHIRAKTNNSGGAFDCSDAELCSEPDPDEWY